MHCNDEKELVKACLNGSREAQYRLYNSYAPRMMSTALRYVGDGDVAQDILQEAFIKAYASLDSFSGRGSLENWIRRIVVNVALEYLRHNDVLREAVELGELNTSPINPTVLDKFSTDELMAIIASLPAGFRTVFNMYAIEGYSHKEIAQMLGISESTSRSQYNRARALIQKRMAELQE